MELTGYRRPDGRVGIRNKVLILPTCSCASKTCAMVAEQVEGAITFTNQNGCSQTKKDVQYTLDVLTGFAANPNIYGTVIVGLGCEVCAAERIYGLIRTRTNKPLEQVVIQESGGTIGAVAKAVEYARRMAEEASRVKREPIALSEIIFATECGGSDATSGLSANPTVGNVCDRVIEAGGTAILSETPEFIGAEHILSNRAATPEIGSQILRIVDRFENYMNILHTNLRDANPAPGNIKGGISTLEEKSLGCIYKGGKTAITQVVDYAKEVTAKGLVVMDTPGNDTASLTAMAAGGAQIAAFTTGRGTPVGNPIMPVIKVTGNRETYRKMTCNMDFCTGASIDGDETIEEVGVKLYDLIMEVINGRKTKAEILFTDDIAIARFCNYT
ncbi:UxaA family hydrolase [Marasmitruncus massiliensis]|uniref:UxaA family hydrolase n=1 Tax=Marasmitruncus massiliensis TaxID=1944642 RepID=UPI000C7BD9F4|nr:UxaA family hydrolase [Marasmitruncus massiliensis]